MTRSAVRIVRGVTALAAVGLLATCQNETAGPGRRAALAVTPVLPAGANLAAVNLTIDAARLIVVSSAADTAFDHTYPFPANQTSLRIETDISLDQSPETFTVTIQLLSATTVLFEGTQDVALSSGSSNPAQIPVTFIGPGQNVASLTIDPADSVLSFGGALTFRATALDGQGASVPSFYVSWTTSDTIVAPIDATGHLVAPSLRRTVTVTAKTYNNVVASTPITFAPVAATLAIVSGCGQSGSLGAQLPQPIVAKVTANDGLGVRGVVVTFTPPAGASVASSQVVTDSAGLAQTLATLGSTSGPAVFQASAPGLTAVPCSQSAFGTASQLAFVTQPLGIIAGNAITPPVVVAAQDAQGTLVPTFTGNVTIALASNPGNASLSGSTIVAAVGGLAPFPDLSLDKIGTGYTLQATGASLTPATSAGFNVASGAAAQLAFAAQPVPTPSGSAITPPVVVIAQDALGNPVSLTGTVTISINTGPVGAALTGTATVVASGGVATFSNLILDKTGTYTLRAQATGLTDAVSAPFDVTAGLSRQTVFITQPSNVTAGAAIAPAVVVEVQDLQGNTDVTFNGSVGIVIRINAGGGTLSGTDTVTAASGVATFSDLSIDMSGVGYTLEAGASGVTAGVSNSFTVNPGAASQLAFVVPPTTVGVGAPIAPVVVGVEDAFGNLVTNATDRIDLRIGVNPPGNAVLGGSTTANAVNGLATFSDLTIDLPGAGFTLVAGSGTLTSATSPPFNVLAGATQFLVQATPATQTAGQPVGIQVTAQDGLGNTVTSYRGTILFSTSDAQGSVPAPYTFTAGDNGSRLFPAGATLKTAGFPYVFVTDQANSSIHGFAGVTVNPDVPFQLAFAQQPTDAVVGAAITPAVQVAIQDQFGNVVVNATNTVDLTINPNPGGGVLTGGGLAGPGAGIVTYGNLSIDKAGTGYTLVAGSGSLTAATSTPFNVLGAATKQWTGAVSTDWSSAGNWTPNGAPTGSDDVLIPSGLTNYPTLSTSSAVRNLTMQSGASIETAGFPLDVFGNLDAGFGQITGTGSVLLDGTGATLQGSLPNVQVGGTVRVIGTVIVQGDLDITGTGVVDLGTTQTVLVTGAITTGSSAVLVDTGGSAITVEGDALFSGGSEAGKLTNGTLQLMGNFTQNGDPESYAASGSFFTVFGGTGTQTVTFANPGSGAGTSHFAGFHVFNTGVGVSLQSAVFANGQFSSISGGGIQAKIFGNTNTLTVRGLACDSLIIDNMPLVVDTSTTQGLFFNDIVFQNFSTSAIQFSLTRTNEVATFNRVSFLSTPNPTAGGRYLVINDPLFADGPFTLTMSNATPPSQLTAGTVTVLGQAILSWP